MKMNAGAKRRRSATLIAALLCALAVGLVFAGVAAAESGDSAPIRPVSEGGFDFPAIRGPEDPEEYPFQWGPLSPKLTARQANDQEIVFEYAEYEVIGWTTDAVPAHDADGATVPTTLKLSEDEEGPVITEIVHYRGGNPAAGGTPFVFPIMEGTGWEGGYRTISFELTEPTPPSTEPQAASPVATPACTVPSLHGLAIRAARSRLRAADCVLGKVHLAPHATRGKGKVVKQFRPSGTQLPDGAPVAIKLGG
jgi:hypothetical protein